MTYIKDALHGYIQLSEEEQELVDTPALQRLRRIQQLGLSSFVYPSATHTRFQHSLGVMHLAGEFADSLELDDRRRKELRIAALLHDTGHGPFSHASELMAKNVGVSHEDFSCETVERLEDHYSVDPRRVKSIIRGELEIGQAVSGDIDADRMDYLMRDAHSSGLEHGHIDASTIIRLAEIDSRRLVFQNKAVRALESLFTSRFHMIKTLYNHHTAVIAEKMLQRALEDYLNKGHKLERMMRMDDYEAHNALLNSEGAAKRIYGRIKNRNLYKRALVWDEDQIPREALKSLEKRIVRPQEVEAEIAEEAGIKPEKVIIDPPKTPEIQDIDVKIKKNGDIKKLSDLSPVIKSFTDAEWRTVAMKVYCPEENRKEVKKASEKALKGCTSALGKHSRRD